MKQPHEFIPLASDELSFQFIPTGDIFEITSGSFFINQFRGNAKDGSANNIYLRIFEDQKISSYALLGISSKSHISYQKNLLRYEGKIKDISYKVDFFIVKNSWFYEVTLDSPNKVLVDLLYGQDIGLSGKENVLANELYISQYLGHSVFYGENGYAICSRQNMPDSGCHPYLQQGVLLNKATHFSTDGLTFFGLSYKESNIPEALSDGLCDRNLQYEFAYAGLQTEKFYVNEKTCTAFYGYFLKNHPAKIEQLDFQQEIQDNYSRKPAIVGDFMPAISFSIKNKFAKPFSSRSFTKEEIATFFPIQKLNEKRDGHLLSFFTPDHAHVVTKEKELATERPHGTIVMTPPKMKELSEPLISSTHYMYGVFNSHVVLGNTNMHKFLSTPRGFLNIHKNSGQRIYIKLGTKYRLLSIPALYEMGINYSRWYYAVENDYLIITAYSAYQNTQIHLEISSFKEKEYDFFITNQLSMGVNEYAHSIQGAPIKNGMRFHLDSLVYPDLTYELRSSEDCILSDDRIFFEENRAFDETFLTMSFQKKSKLHLTINGSYNSSASYENSISFEDEATHAIHQYAAIMNHFALHFNGENRQLAILNETAWWYTHNAMIHFYMPHGLEQPGGAAWGTRDICQGPMEYFIATGNHQMIRKILLNIFSHQEDTTKEWPQWFMFDNYNMNAGECHGDVIFWPLKSVADYLFASGDYAILQEILPYADCPNKKETLFAHIIAAIDQIIETRFIKDTGLITYAGGDWDDTLQPAQPAMKEKLVSTWTVALAYQTFISLGNTLKFSENALSDLLLDLGNKVKEAFFTYAIKDDVIAGFLEWDEHISYLLHPLDDTTGIHYRLLPQTRSIIAELVDKNQAQKNISVINEKLECPDGVRLMDAPASYDGGVTHLFLRAEQAANVGREISLQYTHAHIRYIEAMAKSGNAKKAWDALFQINPILISETVSNACLRQSNMYFSSSEGAYDNRYEYQKNFSLLKTGDIPVKGGWRLYSSGPGIYMHQVISHILGIRFLKDALILDPVLPDNLPAFTLRFDCFGTEMNFHYIKSKDSIIQALCREKPLPFIPLENKYRKAGIQIEKSDILSCGNEITILY